MLENPQADMYESMYIVLSMELFYIIITILLLFIFIYYFVPDHIFLYNLWTSDRPCQLGYVCVTVCERERERLV